ncbi:MAG: hypothetical protein L0H93_21255, partial [Nocardioides sp.]|nr:hypothetical protein [Nocardioides sp.]
PRGGARGGGVGYNRSEAYADVVISLQDEYVAGNYSSPPTASSPSTIPVSARPDLSGVDQAPPSTTPRSETTTPLKTPAKTPVRSESGRKLDTRAKPDQKATRAKDGVKSVGGVKVKSKKRNKATSAPVPAEVPEEVPEECLTEDPDKGATKVDLTGEGTQDATTSDEEPISELAEDPVSQPGVDESVDPKLVDESKCLTDSDVQAYDKDSKEPGEKTIPKAKRN